MKVHVPTFTYNLNSTVPKAFIQYLRSVIFLTFDLNTFFHLYVYVWEFPNACLKRIGDSKLVPITCHHKCSNSFNISRCLHYKQRYLLHFNHMIFTTALLKLICFCRSRISILPVLSVMIAGF